MKTCNNCPHCDTKFALCKLDYKVRPAQDASGKIYTPRSCPQNKIAPAAAATACEGHDKEESSVLYNKN